MERMCKYLVLEATENARARGKQSCVLEPADNARTENCAEKMTIGNCVIIKIAGPSMAGHKSSCESEADKINPYSLFGV